MFGEWLQTKELYTISRQVVLYTSKRSHNLTRFLYHPVFRKGNISKHYNPAVFMFIAAVQIVQNLEEYYIQSKLIAQINENLLIFGN